MRRVLLLVMLLLVAGWAEADTVGGKRDTWLSAFDNPETKDLILYWGTGVHDALVVVVLTFGCKPEFDVSPINLATATAELLRENKTMMPVAAAIKSFGRLSGCNAAIEKWAQSTGATGLRP